MTRSTNELPYGVRRAMGLETAGVAVDDVLASARVTAGICWQDDDPTMFAVEEGPLEVLNAATAAA